MLAGRPILGIGAGTVHPVHRSVIKFNLYIVFLRAKHYSGHRVSVPAKRAHIAVCPVLPSTIQNVRFEIIFPFFVHYGHLLDPALIPP